MAEKFDKYYEYFTQGKEHPRELNIGPVIITRPGWKIRIKLPLVSMGSAIKQVGSEEVQGDDIELINPGGVKRVKGRNVRVINGELELVEGVNVKLVNVSAKKVIGDYVKLVNCDVEELEYRNDYVSVNSRIGIVKKINV